MTEQEYPLPIGSIIAPVGDAPEPEDEDEEEGTAAMLYLPDPEARRGWSLHRVAKRQPSKRRGRWGF